MPPKKEKKLRGPRGDLDAAKKIAQALMAGMSPLDSLAVMRKAGLPSAIAESAVLESLTPLRETSDEKLV